MPRFSEDEKRAIIELKSENPNLNLKQISGSFQEKFKVVEIFKSKIYNKIKSDDSEMKTFFIIYSCKIQP